MFNQEPNKILRVQLSFQVVEPDLKSGNFSYKAVGGFEPTVVQMSSNVTDAVNDENYGFIRYILQESLARLNKEHKDALIQNKWPLFTNDILES
jgi:hypothetical protein